MISISAAKLAQSFVKAGSIVVIKEKKLITELTVNSANYDCLGLVFEKCEFLLNVFFQDVDLNCGVKFINCTFKKNLIFKNITISNYDLDLNYENDSISLQNCTVEKEIVFHTRNKILRDTCFDNTVFGSIQINRLISIEGGLKIRDCTINNNIQIGPNHFLHDILISRTTTKGSFRFENNQTSGYSFIGNTFEADAWIWSGKATGGITFNDGIYKGSFKIQSVISTGYLSIYNAKFESGFFCEYESKNAENTLMGGCQKINIGDSEFNNGLIITGSIDPNVPYEIEQINLDITKKLKGEIVIRKFEINELRISGNNYDANIIFDENKFVKVLFERFTNFGVIQFIDVFASSKNNITKEFCIINSNLGKTLFTNVSFEKFDRIAIDNSHLTEIIASNVKWFQLDQLDKPIGLEGLSEIQKIKKRLKLLLYNTENFDDEIGDYQRKRELFRQLKHAMEQHGNRIQSLIFKQYEMKFFNKEMRLSKRIYDKDRLIMEFSCTNSHGQNWIKPLFILLGLTVLFGFWLFVIFSPYLSSTLSFKAADIKFTFSEFWYSKKIITQILNPTHSLSDIFGRNISFSGWLYGVDILYRVVYAFFVFQIIAAFRKFIK